MEGKNRNPKGFTLIELLTVIVLIGLLSSLVVVSLHNVLKKAEFAKTFKEMKQVYTAAWLYEEDTGGFAPDEDPDIVPDFVPQYLGWWPVSPCHSDVVFDWESWLEHEVTDDEGIPWTPIVRVSLRRVMDDTAIYYLCIQSNQKGKCTCEDVHFGYDRYCKGYAPIQEAPADLSCEDLMSTEKFPSFPPNSSP